MPDENKLNVLVADLNFDPESEADFIEISQEKYSIEIVFKVAES